MVEEVVFMPQATPVDIPNGATYSVVVGAGGQSGRRWS